MPEFFLICAAKVPVFIGVHDYNCTEVFCSPSGHRNSDLSVNDGAIVLKRRLASSYVQITRSFCRPSVVS